MTDIDRRRLLQGAAATSALTALTSPTATVAQMSPTAKLTDIDHIIIMMKENRSFDHYFGTFRGVRGFDDANAGVLNHGRSVFHQPDLRHPDGHVLPFRMDTAKTNAQAFPGLWNLWDVLHDAWNGGKNDNWIPAQAKMDADLSAHTMGYFTKEDVPFYHALADAFTICDGYFSSVMSSTGPNRVYFMTGTNDPEGKNGGPAIRNGGRSFTWETYPERLERAGISWRVYHVTDTGFNSCRNFVQFQNLPRTSPLHEHAMRDRPFEEMLNDIRTGNIPQVTWICPHGGTSEHPPALPARGEDHCRQILQALWSNPALWAKTAFILNYDENEGFFDHVTPPTPEPGTPNEFVNGLPIGLGFRVPCLVVSPFSRGGYVCSDTFDHTSTLRLIEARFGVEAPLISKWRRNTCGDMLSAFGFGEAPRFDVPQMPETANAIDIAQRNATTLPAPVVPKIQAMPKQEPGSRPRRGQRV
jgi:phospholipase C